MVCPTHLVVRSFPGFSLQKCRNSSQREFFPLYPRTYGAPSTATDQIHVGVPYVTPSSRNGEMCRSSASAILRSSSCSQLSFPELLIAHLLHPLHRFSIELFLNCDVRH